jgi:glycosyltransferase involved in cell wall biosynthesis
MRILFGLASPIVRPNGIMTFIRGSAKVLQDMGHTVDFITDAPPPLPLDKWFSNVAFVGEPTNYPIFKDKNGRPSIRYIPEIQNRITRRYADLDRYDVVIGNDAQSTAAFLNGNSDTKVIHYVHTGALLGENRTCLTDSFVAFERELLDYCTVAAQHQHILDVLGVTNGVVIHMPLFNHEQFLPQKDDKKSGLMFIGDGTTSKGADVFERVCATNKWEAKIMGLEKNDVTFDTIPNHDFLSFDIAQTKEKALFIRSAQAGFHPSPCECFPFAVLEQLLSHPVVLNDKYEWTHSFIDLGALVVPPADIELALQMVMQNDYEYDNMHSINYLKQVVPSWRKVLNTI